MVRAQSRLLASTTIAFLALACIRTVAEEKPLGNTLLVIDKFRIDNTPNKIEPFKRYSSLFMGVIFMRTSPSGPHGPSQTQFFNSHSFDYFHDVWFSGSHYMLMDTKSYWLLSVLMKKLRAGEFTLKYVPDFNVSNVKSILYMHSDYFITPDFRFDAEALMTPYNHLNHGKLTRSMKQIHADMRTSDLYWHWMIYIHQLGEISRILGIEEFGKCIVDMYNVPQTAFPMFEKLAPIFGRYAILNEIAVPTIFDLIIKRQNAMYQQVPCIGGCCGILVSHDMEPNATCGHKFSMFDSTIIDGLSRVWDSRLAAMKKERS